MSEKSLKVFKSEKFVDIGTHTLRVILSDIPSEYTIVLESGGGNYSDAYQEIQDPLVKQTGMRTDKLRPFRFWSK